MNLIKNIEKIQEYIFMYDLEKIQKEIIQFTNDFSFFLRNISSKDINVFMEIFEYINIAIKNKDYLLIADLLEFELKPLLEKMN
ncbi:MAG: hypothetical protein N4A64_02895 [Marinisporobacter sp.]|jgi:hypothetical protein|nr:hypothetical protein [Marinisporobacter sp.]